MYSNHCQCHYALFPVFVSFPIIERKKKVQYFVLKLLRWTTSQSLIGWSCFGCSQLSAKSANVPTRNLPSRAPASPLIAFRNSLMLVISFVRPMSARMSDTSQRHSESRRPAEWQSAWGAVPKPPRCQIPTESLTITSPQAPAQADTGNRGK